MPALLPLLPRAGEQRDESALAANYSNFIPKMEAKVREENSEELTTAFREAVSCAEK
jgi:hypothetical protein